MGVGGWYEKGKKIFFELSINTVAFTIFILSQQFVAFPLIARKEPIEFGNILTIFAILNIVSSLLGNGLGQTKLVQKQKYSELGCLGDFKYILLIFSLFSFLFGFSLYFLFYSISFKAIFLGLLFSFSTIRSYVVFDFRYSQKIKEIFYFNLIYSFSLTAIILIYYFLNVSLNWFMIFLIVEIIVFLYYFRRINIFKENISKTILFKDTISKSFFLSLNGGLSYILNSSDRLLINPILGPSSVSIYYSGSFISKIGSLVLNPLNGVILGKLANYKGKDISKISRVIMVGTLLLFIGYFILLIVISPFFIKILYPNYYDEAMKIYIYTSLASSCAASLGVIKQIYIRYGSAQRLSYLMILYAIIFISLALFMTIKEGILGFAISTIISNLFLFLTLLFLFFKLKLIQQEPQIL